MTAGFLLLALLVPQTAAEKQDALVSIDAEGTLEQVARELSSKVGIHIGIQRGADEILGADAVRRLKLTDIPARSAVHWLARTFQTHSTPDDAGGFVIGDRHFRSRFVKRIHDPAGLHFPSWTVPPHVRIHPETDTFDWTPRRTLELREKARLVGDLIGTPGAHDVARRALEWMDEQASEGRQTAFEKAMVELLEQSVPADKREAARKILEEFYASVCCSIGTASLPADLIREHVAPGTWEGDATLDLLPDGKLSVVHSHEVQAEVDALLKGLRLIAARSTLTVEALLLSPDADLEKHALAPMDAPTFARILPSLKPIRRIQARGLEGIWLHAKVAGHEAVDLLSAAGSRDPRDGMLRLQVSLTLGSKDASEMSLATFSSALTLPDAGAALYHLPGRRLLLLHASATAEATPQMVDVNRYRPDPALAAKLDARGKVSFEFEGAALPEVLERFHRETGMNFLSPAVEDPPRVTFRATLSPSAALNLILEPNLAARIHHDAVEILPAGRAPVVTRLLTLRDLATSDGYDGIAQRIKNDVARDHWEEADGKSIWALEDGTLIIRNQPKVLDEVAAYLADLRSRRRATAVLEVAMAAVDPARANELSGETSLGPVVLDRLLRGDLVERVTLRGEAEVPMEMTWAMRRLPSRQDSRCSLVARLTPGRDAAAVSLIFKDPHHTRTDLTTTLRIPAGRAALLRLPDADGRARLLLVRPAAVNP